MRKRLVYKTMQVDIRDSEQLRITLGRRTVFVYANRRGLHIADGGYAPKVGAPVSAIKGPKQMDLPLFDAAPATNHHGRPI